MTKKYKIYIGCSIYNAEKEFVDSVNKLKDELRDKYEVLDFLDNATDADMEQVVKTDLNNVKKADLFCAICDLPSIGLGIEIGKANELKKPTLLFANTENISRMVRGNIYENENSKFIVYSDFEDIKNAIDDFFANYNEENYLFSNLTFNQYGEFTGETAIYPDRGQNIIYPTLGVVGEAGEVAEKVKKFIRSGKDLKDMDNEFKDGLKKEIGDVLWYLSELSFNLGFKFADIARSNLLKLFDRKERNVLHGEGDNR